MFAVIRTGGKQYRVTENDRLEVEKLTVAPGETVRLDDVLLIGGDDGPVRVGAPVLDSAAVFAEVVEHKRDAKVLVFKKRRRKNSRRLRGHRQSLTVLRITGISEDGVQSAPADADAAAVEAAGGAAAVVLAPATAPMVEAPVVEAPMVEAQTEPGTPIESPIETPVEAPAEPFTPAAPETPIETPGEPDVPVEAPGTPDEPQKD